MKYLNKLRNQRVLIFGGTSGIGRAVVDACIEHGAHVTVIGSNQSRLDKVAQDLESEYGDLAKGKTATFQCDLSDAEALDANILKLLSKATSDGRDKFNHVIFTAGDSLVLKPIHDTSISLFIQMQTVRAFAPLAVAKYAKMYMHNSADSSFTVTGGVNTHKPGPNWTLPCAAGAAVEGISKGLAVDLAPIRVNCVEPGGILTDRYHRSTQGIKDKLLAKTTTGRLGQPEDAAEAYLYLLKDTFVTGSVIATNGGYYLK